MSKEIKYNIKKFLKNTVKPAAGCTEVVAIGIATSVCYNAIFNNFPKTLHIKEGRANREMPELEKIESIEVTMDKNVFKNAYGVAIPNTDGRRGIKLAALLGLFTDINKFYENDENPGYLRLFEQVSPDIIQYITTDESWKSKIKISIDNSKTELFIKAVLKYDTNNVETIIHGKHDKIVKIVRNGEVIYQYDEEIKVERVKQQEEYLSVDNILEIIEAIDEETLKELQKTIDTNKLLIEEGLLGKYGMGIVGLFKRGIQEGKFSSDLLTQIKLQVAAGVEARMGGAPYPAMSTSGSGNMGITATVPIIVVAEYYNIDKNRLLKSLLLSHLIVKLASDYVGELSPLCGNTNKSAFGAAAGITYLLGEDKDKNALKNAIENAINYVASTIVGIFCDGAKHGCTLKAMTAASVAYEAAVFSLYGVKVPSDGIVEKNADDTLKNLDNFSASMKDVDDIIVNIIKKRGETHEI